MSPPLALTALEWRSVYEIGTTAALGGGIARFLPKGRRRVLVLPGFLAGDRTTQHLRKALGHAGHEVHGWELGTNLGPTAKIISGLAERVERLTADGHKIDLVGWSLGGIFAREIAREAPELTGRVVTLGTPIQASDSRNSRAKAAFMVLDAAHVPDARQRTPSAQRPTMPVPATSIYSRSDGVVPWRDCLDAKAGFVENVEVPASHCGMGANMAALYVIADRLATRNEEWRPFAPPPWLGAVFPKPAWHQSPHDNAPSA